MELDMLPRLRIGTWTPLVAISAFWACSTLGVAVIRTTGNSQVEENRVVSNPIFDFVDEHVHGPTIVELPNADLLVAWFQGSGERWADDVRIMGARQDFVTKKWSSPFLMADTKGFPDINPVLFIDPKDQLWLVWYTVVANQWETSLLKYRISSDYTSQTGAPIWNWQDVIHVKPGSLTERGIQPNDSFVRSVERQVAEYSDGRVDEEQVSRWDLWSRELVSKARGEDMVRSGHLYDAAGDYTEQKLGYPYFRRMGWQTKNKATILENGRIIIPLYSDGFSFSLMAITEDCGESWHFSEPLVGPGNIQASIVQTEDGVLVAFMRDNGPPPKRLLQSSSDDGGLTWSKVEDSALLNPGSGADLVRLENGNWVLASNDTEQGRHSLAISMSENEAQSWDFVRHLELDDRAKEVATGFAYPAIIQGRGEEIHVVYSFHGKTSEGQSHKTIKYARFDEAWIRAGD
jgi:predicted neuraminidase